MTSGKRKDEKKQSIAVDFDAMLSEQIDFREENTNTRRRHPTLMKQVSGDGNGFLMFEIHKYSLID